MKHRIGLALLAALLLPACLPAGSGPDVRLPPLKIGILEEIAPAPGDRGPLKSLPKLNPKSDDSGQIDLLGRDLRALDLASRLEDLKHADFDTLTKWPDSLPESFDPATIMEVAKNPGLGVRTLHERGITGKGIGIGIIDRQLLLDHVEYKDRLRYYEHMGDMDRVANMHGPAVASIAAGKTVGVAPEADLYFIAAPGSPGSPLVRATWSFRARAIDRLLDINETLAPGNKIRVISISWGAGPATHGYDRLAAAIDKAKRSGVFVITVSVDEFYTMQYLGLGRDPLLDPEDPGSYEIGHFIQARGFGETPSEAAHLRRCLLVPMDSRCMASPTGPHDYAFYGTGGMSWVVPYVAGLYALACQVKPDVTPEEFWKVAMSTATECPFGHIVDPVRLIEALEGSAAGSR